MYDRGLALTRPHGRVRVGDRFISIEPTGTFPDVQAIGDMLISNEAGDAYFDAMQKRVSGENQGS